MERDDASHLGRKGEDVPIIWETCSRELIKRVGARVVPGHLIIAVAEIGSNIGALFRRNLDHDERSGPLDRAPQSLKHGIVKAFSVDLDDRGRYTQFIEWDDFAVE